MRPNYELANYLKARFDLIQKKARSLLAHERGVEPERVRWDLDTLHDLRRTYGTRMARVIPMHVLKEYMGTPRSRPRRSTTSLRRPRSRTAPARR